MVAIAINWLAIVKELVNVVPGVLFGPHHLTRQGRRLLLGLMAVGLTLAAVVEARAADSWIVEDLRGTVVRLSGDHWQEVLKGESIGTFAVLQSLAGSRAILRSNDLRLRLGAKTAVEAAITTQLIALDQYSGTIEIVIASTSVLDLAVRTPGLLVSSPGGRLSIEVNGNVTEIAVLSGTAEAIDTASGRKLVLYDGESTNDLRAEIVEASASGAQLAQATSASGGADAPSSASTSVPSGGVVTSGGVISVAGGNTTSTSDGSTTSSGSSTSAGGTPNSNAGGNPNSNAGGNPNSNAGGNLSSNAGGNPNSNAGGNPNSNAGGNPNSNGGGNPNSNAGGNPNSNAGGNPNSNAGGNPNSNLGGDPNSNTGGPPNSHAGDNPSSNAGGNENSNAGDNEESSPGENVASNAGDIENSNASGNSNPNSNVGGNTNSGGGKPKNNAKGS